MENLDRYKKPYLGSKATQTGTASRKAVQSGFLTEDNVPSSLLADALSPNQLGPGTFGFFDSKTGLSVNAASAQVLAGKMLILANASFHTSDKIGSHGGFQESYKSRGINPRYITGWQKVLCATPEKAVAHLGNTNFTYDVTTALNAGGTGYTDGSYTGVELTSATGTGMLADIVVAGGVVTSVTITAPGSGYVVGDALTIDPLAITFVAGTVADIEVLTFSACNYTFHCGETYNLQIALSGRAVLSVLNHEVPRGVTAFGGCCPTDVDAPTEIDSTLIMLEWAKKIVESTYFNPFIRPVVYDQEQNPLFATEAEATAASYPGQTFDSYVSPGYIAGTLAGIRIEGSYFDTKFSNCSFTYSDTMGIVEPVNIADISLVNDSGFPCKDTLCFEHEHKGFSGQGYGEDVLREFIDDTTRRVSLYCDDARLREIEGGDALLNSFNRNGLYTRFILLHKVPHNENNNQQFTDVNYELNIYIPCNGAVTPTVTTLEAFMTAWLGSVDSSIELETFGHTAFVYEAL